MAHHTATITPFSDNPDFDFEIRNILGQAVGGAADPGEVLAATAGIGQARPRRLVPRLARTRSAHGRGRASLGHRRPPSQRRRRLPAGHPPTSASRSTPPPP